MSPYKKTVYIFMITLIVICTLCYVQLGNNRELEGKITILEKNLSEKSTDYDKAIERLQEVIKEEQEERVACILKSDRLKAEYKDCIPDEKDIFKEGSKANKLKYFLLFVGYARSGHSIVAALLDAHPHVVISEEVQIVLTWRTARIKENYSKYDLFKRILKNSEGVTTKEEFRSPNRTTKYYTLEIPGLFQGRYEDYIEVIGDKSGPNIFYIDNLGIEQILKEVENFQKFEGYPIKFLHIVRNPYDNIASKFLYGMSDKLRKETFLNNKVWEDTPFLTRVATGYMTECSNVQRFIDHFGEMVLTLHNEDLISDPKSFLSKMCDFLEIECNSYYMETAAKSVFAKVTMSRHNVVWSEAMKAKVESHIQKYSFLSRYSFED